MAPDNSSTKFAGMDQSAATSPTDIRGPPPRSEPIAREEDGAPERDFTTPRSRPLDISTSVRKYKNYIVETGIYPYDLSVYTDHSQHPLNHTVQLKSLCTLANKHLRNRHRRYPKIDPDLGCRAFPLRLVNGSGLLSL